jgi:hypothetical protein
MIEPCSTLGGSCDVNGKICTRSFRRRNIVDHSSYVWQLMPENHLDKKIYI